MTEFLGPRLEADRLAAAAATAAAVGDGHLRARTATGSDGGGGGHLGPVVVLQHRLVCAAARLESRRIKFEI